MLKTTPLKVLYQICTYTNCYPPLDFVAFRVDSSNSHIFYVFFLTCLMLAQFIFATYGRCAILKLEFSMLIADTFANIALCGCNIISSLLCYYVGNKFMNKLTLLHANTEQRGATNEAQDTPQNGNQERKHENDQELQSTNPHGNMKDLSVILLVHGIFIILITFDSYVRLYHFYHAAIFYYFFNYLQYYFITTQFLYIIYSMKQIKKLIVFISNQLLDHMNSFLLLPAAEMRESNKGLFTVTGWTKTALNTKANVNDIANVVEASQKYKDIYSLCYYYNVIFGWPLLFAMGVVLFELIEAMNFAVQYPQKHASNNGWVLCLQMLTAGYFYGLQTWMILSCDDITEEVSKFANMIYKQILVISEIQESLAEQLVYSELISLWHHISNNKPRFQAGFITLGRKFIYGSFIGISSFIAVIVEFNRVVNNHHNHPKANH